MSTNSRAFTFIETMVVITIVAVISGSAIAAYFSGREEAEVRRAADSAVATLSLARSRTVASRDRSSWGVHLEAARIVLFRGASYDASDPSNEASQLSDRVKIKNIVLAGGGVDVVFLRPNGNTATSGTFQIVSVSSTNLHTIRVEPSGIIGLDTQAPSTPLNPNQDTRHVHFNLGWSIQNATTLTLTFQDPPNLNVVQNITMAPYFNVGKSRFDWKGTVNVNGSNQTLHIHTHTLNASNTILSVVRDRRFNGKAVTITIDGNTIASYSATGTVTPGAQGGTMTIQ